MLRPLLEAWGGDEMEYLGKEVQSSPRECCDCIQKKAHSLSSHNYAKHMSDLTTLER